jgi:hypothetical protein
MTFPALATIVTVPGDIPVARPLVSIVATPEKLQNQEIVTPVTGLPLESKAVAVIWRVALTATDVDIGEILILATLDVTVSVAALLVIPPDDAVICVVPGATPTAFPLTSTVATLGALLVHVSAAPTELLFASTGAAKYGSS